MPSVGRGKHDVLAQFPSFSGLLFSSRHTGIPCSHVAAPAHPHSRVSLLNLPFLESSSSQLPPLLELISLESVPSKNEYCGVSELVLAQGSNPQWINQIFSDFELPNVPSGFRKGGGTRDQVASICWIIEKAQPSNTRDWAGGDATSKNRLVGETEGAGQPH